MLLAYSTRTYRGLPFQCGRLPSRVTTSGSGPRVDGGSWGLGAVSGGTRNFGRHNHGRKSYHRMWAARSLKNQSSCRWCGRLAVMGKGPISSWSPGPESGCGRGWGGPPRDPTPHPRTHPLGASTVLGRVAPLTRPPAGHGDRADGTGASACEWATQLPERPREPRLVGVGVLDVPPQPEVVL